jgi:hypothetical protein
MMPTPAELRALVPTLAEIEAEERRTEQRAVLSGDVRARQAALRVGVAIAGHLDRIATALEAEGQPTDEARRSDQRGHAIDCDASRRRWYWPRDLDTIPCTCGADGVARASARLTEAIADARRRGGDVSQSVEDALALLNCITREASR